MSWSAAGLVAAWESAAGLNPPARTATLLATLGPAGSVGAALEYDVGAAASLLASGHAAAFGPEAEVVVRCPACGTSLEARVALTAGGDPTTGGAHAPVPDSAPVPDGRPAQGGRGGQAGDPVPEATGGHPGPRTPSSPRRVDGHVVRLPTLGELAAVHGSPEAGSLLRRWCVQPPPATAQDPPTAVEAALEELAGEALLHGPVSCPECRAGFEASLDVAELVWERIAAEVPRLLAETAALARAYGWSEAAILGLSPARREAYLALAGARP